MPIMDGELYYAARQLEAVKKLRVATEVQNAHLARTRECQFCGTIFSPKSLELCPVCSSRDSKLARNGKRTCKYCEHTWRPVNDCCPACFSCDSTPSPRQYPIIDKTNASLKKLEDELAGEVRRLIRREPVWQDWAKDVKGLGEVTLAKILSKTDFTRVDTVSKFWSHCGYGLDKNGKPQRKVAGETISYDPQLRAACYLMGDILCMQQDAYYQYYVKAKKKALASPEVKSPAHANNRAKREMVKLALSHIWEKAREAEGLPAPRPYAFSILGHDESHYIAPEDMVSAK